MGLTAIIKRDDEIIWSTDAFFSALSTYVSKQAIVES